MAPWPRCNAPVRRPRPPACPDGTPVGCVCTWQTGGTAGRNRGLDRTGTPVGRKFPVNNEGRKVPVNNEGRKCPVNNEGRKFPVNNEGRKFPVNNEGTGVPGEQGQRSCSGRPAGKRVSVRGP